MRLGRLCVITPGDHGHGVDRVPWIRALAGVEGMWVLIREPGLPSSEAIRFRDAAGDRPLVWHRRSGDHGPNRHWPSTERLRPDGGSHGQSCHSRVAMDRAFADGAAYALLSPVWRPTSKPHDQRPVLGPAIAASWADDRVVFALGGVDPQRARVARAAGLYGVAVLGGVFGGASPKEAADRARAYVAALTLPRR